MDIQGFCRVIEDCFPELPVESAEPLPGGVDYLTIEVNEEFGFRHPRLSGDDAQVGKKIALLPEMARVLTVPIPEPIFAWHGGGRHPRSLFGYRKIEGGALSRGYIDEMGAEHLAQR